MASIRAYWRLFRPLTALSTVTAAIGGSLYGGVPEGSEIALMALTIVGVALAHFSVNALNDYLDYKSGLDLRTPRTPFSGGSKVLVDGLLSPRQALVAFSITFLLAFSIGLIIAALRGPLVLLFAAGGAIIIGTYNKIWLKIYLGEASVVAKGLLVFLGSMYAVHGELNGSAASVGILYGLLSTALLFVNEIPDVMADKSVGRRTLAYALGERAYLGYSFIVILYAIILLYSIYAGLLPLFALASLLPLSLAYTVSRDMMRRADPLSVMGKNAKICRAGDALLTLSIAVRALLQRAYL